jgi:DNA-binding ferritin-like protein
MPELEYSKRHKGKTVGRINYGKRHKGKVVGGIGKIPEPSLAERIESVKKESEENYQEYLAKKKVRDQEKILEADREIAQQKRSSKLYKARVKHRKEQWGRLGKSREAHLFSNIKKDTRKGKHGLRIF